MFDNNMGVSESQPDFDWSVIEGVQSKAVEGTHSRFYKYLVNENTRSYTLAENFNVPYSGYVSSAQEIGANTVIDTGFAGVYKYDFHKF